MRISGELQDLVRATKEDPIFRLKDSERKAISPTQVEPPDNGEPSKEQEPQRSPSPQPPTTPVRADSPEPVRLEYGSPEISRDDDVEGRIPRGFDTPPMARQSSGEPVSEYILPGPKTSFSPAVQQLLAEIPPLPGAPM